MPKKWSEIQADPNFLDLPPAEQQKVADGYFQKRVANDPNFLGLPPQEQEKVKAKFSLKPATDGFKTAENIAGKVGAGLGIAAPLLGAVTGSPAVPMLGLSAAPAAGGVLPLVGGMGLGALAGLGTEYLMNEVNVPERIPIPGSAGAGIPMPEAIAGRPLGASLKAGAQGLREFDPIPDPETQSVGLNMLLSGAKASLDPIEKLAGLMEAGPQIASTAAAMRAGLAGGKMLTPSKVPVGQEAAALGKVAEQFGGVARKPSAPTQGGLQELLTEGRTALGKVKGRAEEEAFKLARPYTNMGEQVAESLGKTHFNPAFPKGHPDAHNPALATNPAAAGEVMGSARTALNEVTDLQGAKAVGSQLAEKAALARGKFSQTKGQAPILSEASSNVDSMIKSFLNPAAPETANLQAANAKFTKFRNLEDLFKGTADAKGIPSPQRILARWNKMPPAERADKFGEGAGIVDAILKQKDPNIISRGLTKLWNGVITFGNTRLGHALKAGGQAPPVRLNAPNPYSMTAGIPGLSGNTGLSDLVQVGAGAGAEALEPKKETLRNRYRANISSR